MFKETPEQVSSPGRALAYVLRRAHITREEIAERLSVSVDTVNKWCRGRSTMRVVHFGRLLSLLVERGLPTKELQTFLSDFLTCSGLSPAASVKLLPPSRVVHHKELVLIVAPEALTMSGMRFVVAGARDYLRLMGIEVLVASDCGSVALSCAVLADMILTTDPFGVILFRDIHPDVVRLVLEAATERKAPLVGLELPVECQGRVGANVTINNYTMGYDAGKYLIEQGYMKPGFIGNPQAGYNIAERFRGFQQALRDEGLELTADAVFSRPEPAQGESRIVVEETISSWRPVTRKALESLAQADVSALFCSFDSAALALVSEFNHLAFDSGSGEEINLVAVTTSQWPDLLSAPKLAYFLLPTYQMGFEAARYLTLLASNSPQRLNVRNLELQCEFRQCSRGARAST